MGSLIVNPEYIAALSETVNSLSEQIAELKSYKYYKKIGDSNGSKSTIVITIPSSCSGEIMVSADSTSRNYKAMYRVTSGGSVSVNEIVKGNQVTATTSGATLTITTSNSGSSVVYEMRCYGSGTTTVSYS